MSLVTTTLYKYIQSELIKNGSNEITNPKDDSYFYPPLDFVWFDDEVQFTTKILKYDEDIKKIVNDLFGGLTLKNSEHDTHFKKGFINRFIDRQINRQTIEAFKMQLVATFLSKEQFLNTTYENMEKFMLQNTVNDQQNNQTNKQSTDGKTTSDNRSAFADLPQSSTNLDVDNNEMKHATDNTISKNRQENNQTVDNESTGNTRNDNKVYSFDELMKGGSVLDQLYNDFDVKCFLQIW